MVNLLRSPDHFVSIVQNLERAASVFRRTADPGTAGAAEKPLKL